MASALRQFRAIRVSQFGGPSVLQMGSNTLGEPKGKQVLIKLGAAGVNPIDTYQRSGNYAALPQLPFTPGKDGAGVVVSVGESVTKYKPGDRVYCFSSISGTYAEMTLSNEEDLGRLHDKLSFEEGACLGVPYLTAYRALFHKGNCKKGETVLIHGASGGVGIGCIQFAKHSGLKVIGTAGTEDGLMLIKSQGADVALNHNSEGYLQHVLEASGGKGVNLIIENLANVNLGNDLTVLSRGGRVVIVGSRGPTQINPRDIMSRDAIVTGFLLFNGTREELIEAEEAIFKGQQEGYLKPVVGQELPLEDAKTAHELVVPSDRPSSGAKGKIVLSIKDS